MHQVLKIYDQDQRLVDTMEIEYSKKQTISFAIVEALLRQYRFEIVED